MNAVAGALVIGTVVLAFLEATSEKSDIFRWINGRSSSTERNTSGVLAKGETPSPPSSPAQPSARSITRPSAP